MSNGQTYYYWVTAVNGIGEGSASSEVSVFLPLIVPGAPQSVSASELSGSIVLTWFAPLNDGGSSINSYQIFRGTSSGSETYLTTVYATSFTDTSVKAGQTYHYQVCAVNSIGSSKLSIEISAVAGVYITIISWLIIIAIIIAVSLAIIAAFVQSRRKNIASSNPNRNASSSKANLTPKIAISPKPLSTSPINNVPKKNQSQPPPKPTIQQFHKVPVSEYGHTEVQFNPRQLPNASPQPLVKSHPGIEPGDFLESEGIFYEIQDQFRTGGLSTIFRAKETTHNEIIIVKQYLKAKFFNQSTHENECETFWKREAEITQLQSQSPFPCMHFYGVLKFPIAKDFEYYLFWNIFKEIQWIYGILAKACLKRHYLYPR